MINSKRKLANTHGFTLVELLIVIVVIAILAAITIVAYGNISKQAAQAAVKSELSQAATQLGTYQVDNGAYPLTSDVSNGTYTLKHSADTTFSYLSTDGTSYTLTATSSRAQTSYCFTSAAGTIADGPCASGTVAIQTITSSSCPSSPTVVQDARDSRTYWIKKLLDGKCWMLTNLGYAGGGTNTYGDVMTLNNGTSDSALNNLVAKYYIPTGANVTTGTPSSSTDGTGQYGYLYNWCAAMGAQATAACSSSSTTPTPVTTTSVCPAGWRLPTGNGGEVGSLNTAINSGSTTSSTGLLTNWYGQWSGNWDTQFYGVGTYATYWTSTQKSGSNAYDFYFDSSSVLTADNFSKGDGFAVRCVAY